MAPVSVDPQYYLSGKVRERFSLNLQEVSVYVWNQS